MGLTVMRIHYICAECGAIVWIEEESLDTGTTFKCSVCWKDTVIVLMTREKYKELHQ
jgi:DNA-directed RNA polymerase subunit RPC12/RpoP